jgi:hypothetical protein
MSTGFAPKGKKEIVWSEESPIMSFFKDGDFLRITAETLTGGIDECYLSKQAASQLVQFIQANATTRKNLFAI